MKTVMVIEDDADTRFLLGEFLKMQGMSAVKMPNAEDALDYLESNPAPDAILLDLSLPGQGAEFFRKKQTEISQATAAVPVALASGRHDISEWAERLGAKAFVRKPYDLDQLGRMIKEICG